jgi:hypothetical protein
MADGLTATPAVDGVEVVAVAAPIATAASLAAATAVNAVDAPAAAAVAGAVAAAAAAAVGKVGRGRPLPMADGSNDTALAATCTRVSMKGVSAAALECFKIKSAATDAARAGYIDMYTVEETTAAIQSQSLPHPHAKWNESQKYAAIVALSLADIAECKGADDPKQEALVKQGRVFWHKVEGDKYQPDSSKRALQRIVSKEPFRLFTGIIRAAHAELTVVKPEHAELTVVKPDQATVACGSSSLPRRVTGAAATTVMEEVDTQASVGGMGQASQPMPPMTMIAAQPAISATTQPTGTAIRSGTASPIKLLVSARADLSRVTGDGNVAGPVGLSEIAIDQQSVSDQGFRAGMDALLKQAVMQAGLDPNSGQGANIIKYVQQTGMPARTDDASSLALSAYGHPTRSGTSGAARVLLSMHTPASGAPLALHAHARTEGNQRARNELPGEERDQMHSTVPDAPDPETAAAADENGEQKAAAAVDVAAGQGCRFNEPNAHEDGAAPTEGFPLPASNAGDLMELDTQVLSTAPGATPDPAADWMQQDTSPAASSDAQPCFLSLSKTPMDVENRAKQANSMGVIDEATDGRLSLIDDADEVVSVDTPTEYLESMTRLMANPKESTHSGASVADRVAPLASMLEELEVSVEDVAVTAGLQPELQTFFTEIALDTSDMSTSWKQHSATIVRYTGRSKHGLMKGSIVCVALCTHEHRIKRRPPPPLHMTELFALTASMFARRWSGG